MPRARKHLVCLADAPYYHVYSRCVRRAFLCGVDPISGKSYEHRRGWIEDRVRVLASLFSIDLCAYAVMSNHYHLVVRLAPATAAGWSDDEVLERWTSLYKGPLLVQRYRAGAPLSAPEQETVRSTAAVYRTRLASLSWFMKCLNEPIARQANAEDRCTGHFWEARFHSQALCSDHAVLAAMAYVDLNPIRAQIAQTPEASDYTSIKFRLRGGTQTRAITESISRMLRNGELNHFDRPIRPLLPFADDGTGDDDEDPSFVALPMRERDYFQLVDTTGRYVARGKRGRIDPALAPIVIRLGLSAEQWIEASTAFRMQYRNGDLKLGQSA